MKKLFENPGRTQFRIMLLVWIVALFFLSIAATDSFTSSPFKIENLGILFVAFVGLIIILMAFRRR